MGWWWWGVFNFLKNGPAWPGCSPFKAQQKKRVGQLSCQRPLGTLAVRGSPDYFEKLYMGWDGWELVKWRTLGGPVEDPWRARGGPSEDPWRTPGGPSEDFWRTRGGPVEGSRRTLGGPLEDPRRTLGGTLEGSRPNAAAISGHGRGSTRGPTKGPVAVGVPDAVLDGA